MFKKRKERKAQELSDRRAMVEQEFSEAIRKASGIKDPAEKIIELQAIDDQIDDTLANDYVDGIVKGNKSIVNVGLGGGVGSIVTGTVVACAVAGPVGVAVMGAGMLAGMSSPFAGYVRAKSVLKRHQEGMTEHVESLTGLKTRIEEMTDETIELNLKKIYRSPLYGQLRALPGLTEKFADAAGKHLSAGDAPVAAPVKKLVLEKISSSPSLNK